VNLPELTEEGRRLLGEVKIAFKQMMVDFLKSKNNAEMQSFINL
jgi:hypothetical protein